MRPIEGWRVLSRTVFVAGSAGGLPVVLGGGQLQPGGGAQAGHGRPGSPGNLARSGHEADPGTDAERSQGVTRVSTMSPALTK